MALLGFPTNVLCSDPTTLPAAWLVWGRARQELEDLGSASDHGCGTGRGGYGVAATLMTATRVNVEGEDGHGDGGGGLGIKGSSARSCGSGMVMGTMAAMTGQWWSSCSDGCGDPNSAGQR